MQLCDEKTEWKIDKLSAQFMSMGDCLFRTLQTRHRISSGMSLGINKAMKKELSLTYVYMYMVYILEQISKSDLNLIRHSNLGY